jgi:hypothetical protein
MLIDIDDIAKPDFEEIARHDVLANALGFTGTQKGWTTEQAYSAEYAIECLRKDFLWMNNEGCIGSDAQAAHLWQSKGGFIYLHPPILETKRAFIQAEQTGLPLSYLERNEIIISMSSCLLATPGEMTEQLRSGTWSTVRYARRSRISIVFVYPDGSTFHELATRRSFGFFAYDSPTYRELYSGDWQHPMASGHG